jgi:hypothetical protein
MEIGGWIGAGVPIGILASLFPNRKTGCAVLWVVPIAMLVYVYIGLADLSRGPDALDALVYIFGPLYPSIGALAGFIAGRIARAWAMSLKPRPKQP